MGTSSVRWWTSPAPACRTRRSPSLTSTARSASRRPAISPASSLNGPLSRALPGAGRSHGLQRVQSRKVGVSVDQETSLDIKLQVGELSETVEVTAGTPLLKTERSDVATTFSEKTVASLPILNRRFTAFELLTPGVQATTSQTAVERGPAGLVSEGRERSEFCRVRRICSTAPTITTRCSDWIVINPTLESLTEAKITTANYDAEFGATRRRDQRADQVGHQHPPRRAVVFPRNDIFRRATPSHNSRKSPGTDRYIPETRWNQFGGALGGPIQKQDLLLRRLPGDATKHRRIGTLLRVPSAAERQGDLSELGLDIFDPASGATLAERARSPATDSDGRLSPQAQNLLQLIPLPNIAAPREISPTTRLRDHQVQRGSRQHALGLLPQRDNPRFAPLQPAGLPHGLAGHFRRAGGRPRVRRSSPFAGISRTRNQSIAAGFNHTFGPSLLTDFRFGWFRYNVNVDRRRRANPAADAGIPGLNVDDFTRGMPAFLLNGYGPGGNAETNSISATRSESTAATARCARTNVSSSSSTTGRSSGATTRSSSAGYPPRDEPADSQRPPPCRRAAVQCGPNPGAHRRRLGLASFLLGDVSVFERYVSSVTDAEERQNRWFFYGQDQWKATPLA